MGAMCHPPKVEYNDHGPLLVYLCDARDLQYLLHENIADMLWLTLCYSSYSVWCSGNNYYASMKFIAFSVFLMHFYIRMLCTLIACSGPSMNNDARYQEVTGTVKGIYSIHCWFFFDKVRSEISSVLVPRYGLLNRGKQFQEVCCRLLR